MPETPAGAASPGGSSAVRLALGLDWGERRIGVAAGDTLTRTARPLGLVPAHAGRPEWPALERYFREWQPAVAVVGVPYNMDGTESRLTQPARDFALAVRDRFGVEVIPVDERLSSREAEDILRRSRASGARTRRVRTGDVDPVAACVLLEQWLRAPAAQPASE